MSRNIFEDERRDDVLARALGEALPRPPVDDVDWDTLHARITSSARPLLRRAPATRAAWWQPLAQWSPRGIPLAAAASAVLLLGAAWLGTAAQPAAAAGEFVMVEEALAVGAGYEAQPLFAGVETTDMIEAVLFGAAEEW
jgi:hypothetical protein